MHEIVTEIDLPADAARVWAVLTDFAGYHAWNPSIRSIEGTLAEGARLHLHLRPEALRQSSNGAFGALTAFAFRSWLALNRMRLPVLVTRLLPQRELRWVGALSVPSVFRGEHFFRIREKRDGGTQLAQGERYEGWLEPAFREAMEAINRDAMSAVNRALKIRLQVEG